MSTPPLLIRRLSDLRRHYSRLAAGDLVLGPMAVKPGEEIKLFDLAERGVRFFPPLEAQLLAGRKTAQAQVLGEFMLPGTVVVFDLPHLAACLGDPRLAGPVVAKRDRAHLGLGVSRWESLEALHSLACLTPIPFPLVLQPFLEGARDLRAVVVGEYHEAYERFNPEGFRKNLFQGGTVRPAAMTPALLDFCRRVMARGRFPYAVLDLLLSPAGEVFLSEINFHAGLKGSRLGQEEYRRQVQVLLEEVEEQWADSCMTRP
jgi:ribosomal protein S6--L-glutamate ligase